MLWIAVCTIIGVALVLYALMDIAKREDRMMRRIERSANPFSDVTVTRGRQPPWPALPAPTGLHYGRPYRVADGMGQAVSAWWGPLIGACIGAVIVFLIAVLLQELPRCLAGAPAL